MFLIWFLHMGSGTPGRPGARYFQSALVANEARSGLTVATLALGQERNSST
jgi:hypothetical protein